MSLKQTPHQNTSNSIWATVTPAPVVYPQLSGTHKTNTVVIGAGFTGLSTALHLRENNIDVTVIDAQYPGWGASGRNNGQVIPTLSKVDPDEIETIHGASGERFVNLIANSASYLFDLARKYNIKAEAEQTGWVQPVHSPGRIRIAENRYRQWQRRGAQVEFLNRDATQRMTGSAAWFGGFWNKSGGHINPLGLAQGLAQALSNNGGLIFNKTTATDFTYKNQKWHITTPQGLIIADALVLASNAYTGQFAPDLAPHISKQVIPVLSWQMATKPLTAATQAQILPKRQAMSDTHGELYFARWDQRNRLITGGNLLLPLRRTARLKKYVASRINRLWPATEKIEFDYVWNGYVGMTNDFMPRFHSLGNNAWAWTGCNGRGVALSISVGRELAYAVQGRELTQLALPFTSPKPLKLYKTVKTLAPLMLLRYRQRDRKELSTTYTATTFGEQTNA